MSPQEFMEGLEPSEEPTFNSFRQPLRQSKKPQQGPSLEEFLRGQQGRDVRGTTEVELESEKIGPGLRGPLQVKTREGAIDLGPRRMEDEPFEAFQRRASTERKFQRAAQQVAQQKGVGRFIEPEKKPSVSQKLARGAAKVSAGEFLQGLSEAATAVAEPFTAGLGEPLRQSAVLLRGLGLDVAQDTAVVGDYLRPRELGVEGFGANVLQGLGSTGTFAAASALGGGGLVGAYGAVSNAGQTFEEAQRAGYTRDQALVAAVPAAIIGYLERFGFGGQGLEKAVTNQVAKGFIEEAGQEVTTQLLNNINAKLVAGYDPNRAISEGVLESGIIGGIIGGGIPGGVKVAGKAAEVGPRVLDATSAFLRSEEGSFDPQRAKERLGQFLQFSKVKKPDGTPTVGYQASTMGGLISPTTIDVDENVYESILPGTVFYQNPEKASQVVESSMSRAQILAGTGSRASGKNIRPFYLDIRNPFDQEAEYGADSLQDIIDTVDATTGSDVASSSLQIIAEEIRDGVREGITGEEILDALNRQRLDTAQIKDILKEAGFDGFTFISEMPDRDGRFLTKEFLDLEEAKAYAEDTGGRLYPEGGARVTTDPNDPTKKQSIGPTVSGTRAWIPFYPEQLKSATGNVGTFDPSTPDIAASVALPEVKLATDEETRQSYQQRSKDLVQQMLGLDPTGPEFESLQSEWIKLQSALMDGETLLRAEAEGQDVQEILERWSQREGGVDPSMIQELAPTSIKEEYESIRNRAWRRQMKFFGFSSEDALRMAEVEAKRELSNKYSDPYRKVDLDFDYSEGYEIRQYQGAKAPSLIVPESFFEAYIADNPYYYGSGLNGVAVPFEQIAGIKDTLQRRLPEKEYKVAIRALDQVAEGANRVGADRITVIKARPDHMGVYSTIVHEMVHSGQGAALSVAEPQLRSERPNALGDLHSENINQHPLVQRALSTEEGKFIGRNRAEWLAMEMVAHFSQGQGGYTFGTTVDERASYIMDYMFDILEHRGPEVLNAFVDAALLTPDLEQRIKDAKGYYGNLLEIQQRQRSQRASRLANVVLAGRTNEEIERAALGQGPDPNLAPASVERETELYTAQEIRDQLGLAEGEPLDEALAAGAIEEEGEGVYSIKGGPPLVDLGEAEGPYEQIISTGYLQEGVEAFRALLERGGVKYNPKVAPSSQLYAAMEANPDLIPGIQAKLESWGIPYEQFLDDTYEAFSTSGRNLQLLSNTHQEEIKEMIKGKKPREVFRNKPAKVVLNAAIKDLERSRLGKNWNQRTANRLRNMALGQLGIAAFNAISVAHQIPLRMVSNGMAAMMQSLKQGDGNFSQRLREGVSDSYTAMQGGIEVIMSLSPKGIKDRIQRRSLMTQDVADTLEKIESIFPDVYAKITGPKSYIEETGQQKLFLELMQETLKRVKNPQDKARLGAKIQKLHTRYRRDSSLLGRAVSGVDWAYELPTRPNRWQEFFIRPAYFVGEMRAAFDRAGMDMAKTLSNRKLRTDKALQKKVKQILQAPLDETLELTYAYDPKFNAPGTVGIERGAAHMLQALNQWGTLGFAVEAFPKALYNGLKFLHEWAPTGLIQPGLKAARGEDFDYKDFHRLSKAMVGTLGMVLAWGLREALGGDEWWQLKTGARRQDGTPVYWDARRNYPVAAWLWLADRTDKFARGELGDIQLGKELSEQYLRLRRAGDEPLGIFTESLDALGSYWGGSAAQGAEGKLQQGKQALGRQLALPLNPLLNLRDLWAEFSEAESLRRDPRDLGVWGPSIDKLPWLRTRLLPEAVSPTGAQPERLSEQPGLGLLGGVFKAGENPAGQEFQRLGLNVRTWLKRDPDPKIDRAQTQFFNEIIGQQGQAFLQDPGYQKLSSDEKRAQWERLATAVASEARKFAKGANIEETMRRETTRAMGGPWQRKALQGAQKGQPK